MSYLVHQGRLGRDLRFPSPVLHWLGAASTPLGTTEEEKKQVRAVKILFNVRVFMTARQSPDTTLAPPGCRMEKDMVVDIVEHAYIFLSVIRNGLPVFSVVLQPWDTNTMFPMRLILWFCSPSDDR